ncbi:GtrA family protein [Flexilinea flocculi]|nr:GtrA family protein [Flexilinea flocculi]NMB93399.1 GtrA family protein [Flexilinea flocculi]
MMKDKKLFLRNLILYGIIGGISAGFDAAVFASLYKGFRIDEFIANIFSVHCGIFLSFFLNSRYNFRKTDKIKKRFTLFYLTGLFGLGLSSLILFLGNLLEVDIFLTKLFSIVFVALVQFFINRLAAFGDRQ